VHTRSWPEQSLSFGIFFFCYFGFVGVFPPYVSLFFAHRGIGAVEIGILMSLMQAMRIVGPNLWGWAADASGKRSKVLQLTALASFLVFFTLPCGNTFFQFALIMIAINLFTSAQGPLSDAIMLAEMRDDLTRYGQLRLWGSVGFIVLTATVGLLLDRYGMEWMPWIGAAILCASFVVSLRIYDSPQVYQHSGKTSIIEALKRKEIMAFMVSACFMMGGHAALYAFFSLYLAKLGYSSMTIGLMWALGAAAEIVFFIFQAPIVRRVGLKTVMLGSLLLAVVRFALIGVGAHSLLILLLAQVLHAFTFGAHHTASIITMQRWFAGPLQARGQALYISASYGIGCTIGGLFLSLIWGKMGPQAVYLIAAFLALCAFGFMKLSFYWQNSNE
jgi:PPP family 3-phenylpropionic acid transporter